MHNDARFRYKTAIIDIEMTGIKKGVTRNPHMAPCTGPQTSHFEYRRWILATLKSGNHATASAK
jgi:hypothetical protein